MGAVVWCSTSKTVKKYTENLTIGRSVLATGLRLVAYSNLGDSEDGHACWRIQILVVERKATKYPDLKEFKPYFKAGWYFYPDVRILHRSSNPNCEGAASFTLI